MLIKSEDFYIRFGVVKVFPFLEEEGYAKNYTFRIQDEKEESVITFKSGDKHMLDSLINVIYSNLLGLEHDRNAFQRHPKTGEFILDITDLVRVAVGAGAEVEYLRIYTGKRVERVRYGAKDLSKVQKDLKKVRDAGGIYVRIDNGIVQLKERALVFSAVNNNFASRNKAEDGVYRTHAYIRLPYTKDRLLVTIVSQNPHTHKSSGELERFIINDFAQREIINFTPKELNIKVQSVLGFEVNFCYLPEGRKWIINPATHLAQVLEQKQRVKEC